MRFVKSGEKVLITEHNHIIAEIVPASIGDPASDHLTEYLEEESAQGKIERAERKVFLKEGKIVGASDMEEIRKIYHETRAER